MAKTSMQDEFPRFRDTTKSNISDISVPNGYRNQPLATKRVADTISGDTRKIVNDVNLTEELQHLSVSSEERKQIIPRSGAHHCVHGQDAAIIGNQNRLGKESRTTSQDSSSVNNSAPVLLREMSPNEKPPPVQNVAKPGIVETSCSQFETCQRIGDIYNSQYHIESGKNETRGNPYNREVDRPCQNEISNKGGYPVLRKAQNEYEANVSENTLEDEGFAKSHCVLELQQKESFAPNKPAVCSKASNSTWNHVNGGTEIGIPDYKIYHKAIRKNFPRLTDELDIAAILDHLYARDIINQETYDTLIKLSDTPITCNRTSLQYLMHNKPKLPEFMKLLRIEQKDMASVIDTAAKEIRSELSASVVSGRQMQQELGQGDKANITDQTTASINLTLKDTKSCTSTDRHNCPKIMWTFENQCGTEEQVKKMKSKFFDFREKMMKDLPDRTYSSRVKSNPYCVECPCPKISIGEENGDEEALKILKANLIDFESEVFDHTAKAVETHIGCIRIVVRPHDIHHLQKLYFDIVESQTVTRINKWFREHCKSVKLPDGGVPQFGLAVNEEEVCSAKLHFAATNAGSCSFLFTQLQFFIRVNREF